MASNGKPQLLRSIFSQQSNGAGDERLQRFGRQDKTALRAVHQPSRQPEPVRSKARSQRVNTKPQRSQKRSSAKRKTIHLVLWVNPIVKDELERIAKREGLSLSKSGAAFLKRSLQQNIDLEYSALLTPIIEAAIDRRMRARDARLAWLLVRIGFASEQTRAIVTNILGRQQGMTEETLKNILAMSQRTAKGNITRTSPDLREIMNALEDWLLSEEQEQGN